MLGAFDRAAWPERSFDVHPGHTLVAITDGVTDAVGENRERFGSARLHDVLADARDEDPTIIRERLIAALDRFQVGAQTDDTAAVVMRMAQGRSSGEPTEIAKRVTAGKAGNDAYDDQAIAV